MLCEKQINFFNNIIISMKTITIACNCMSSVTFYLFIFNRSPFKLLVYSTQSFNLSGGKGIQEVSAQRVVNYKIRPGCSGAQNIIQLTLEHFQFGVCITSLTKQLQFLSNCNV